MRFQKSLQSIKNGYFVRKSIVQKTIKKKKNKQKKKKFEFNKISKINNFEKNPKKGGTPAIENKVIVTEVTK